MTLNELFSIGIAAASFTRRGISSSKTSWKPKRFAGEPPKLMDAMEEGEVNSLMRSTSWYGASMQQARFEYGRVNARTRALFGGEIKDINGKILTDNSVLSARRLSPKQLKKLEVTIRERADEIYQGTDDYQTLLNAENRKINNINAKRTNAYETSREQFEATEAARIKSSRIRGSVGLGLMLAKSVINIISNANEFYISGIGMDTGNSSLQSRIDREMEKVDDVVNVITGTFSGTGAGAIAGFKIGGPIGAGIGAVVGTVAGALSSETNRQNKYAKRERDYQYSQYKFDTARSIAMYRAGDVASGLRRR